MTVKQETAAKLAELYQAVANGGELQICNGGDWEPVDRGPSLCDSPEDYRIKPKSKTIDVSPLVDSGIECHFSDSVCPKGDLRGGLRSILLRLRDSAYRYESEDDYHRYCRPIMKQWHPWNGGKRPIPEGLHASVRRRDGAIANVDRIAREVWEHEPKDGSCDQAMRDIVAVRFDGVKDGYVWEGQRKC